MSKRQPNMNFHHVKFNFKELKKFITMELNLKVSINDLRENFSKLLATNFFAKRLVFIYGLEQIDPSQNLEIFFEKNFFSKKERPPSTLEIDVETEQEGA